MRTPDSLVTLADYGLIDEVVRPLMSGKEAQIYLVISDGQQRVAKIYKEAQNRSFKHRAEYTEGRKVRNTRDQRAISNRSGHGKAADEAEWRAAEVSIIYRLQEAGVRVPVPYHFVDGVLVMELITDADGNPAPRLGDLDFDGPAATAIYHKLLGDVVRMLCAGVVHGDLSDFNVLMAADGPVLIDFPQSVDPAHNQNARRLLLRDVDNLHHFLTRSVRNAPRLPYAEEMWELYQGNLLTPEIALTGRYQQSQRAADTKGVLALIGDVRRDELRRREYLGLKTGPVGASPSERRPAAPPARGDRAARPSPQRPPEARAAARPKDSAPAPGATPTGGATPAAAGARRSRRRRRRRSPAGVTP